MKHLLFVLSPLAVALLLFTSCSSVKPGELSDRLIAEAIGIDLKDGGYDISVQALDIGTSGSGENAADETTRIYHFFGSTPAAAFGSAQATTGLNPLYSHARLLIISREAAETKLSELLDFFLREFTARSDILVAVAEASAAEIVSADLGTGKADAALAEKTMEKGCENGANVTMPLYRFVNLLLTPGDAAYCPVVVLKKAENEKKNALFLEKTAVFDSEKMLFTVDGEATKGILLLNNMAGNMLFPVRGNNGSYMLSTVKSKTKITPSLSDGKLSYQIETELICDLTEFSGSGFSGITDSDIEDAQIALGKAIEEKEKRVLESVCRLRGCDVCRLGRKTLLKYPALSEKDLQILNTKAQYNIRVTASVRRTGREIIQQE